MCHINKFTVYLRLCDITRKRYFFSDLSECKKGTVSPESLAFHRAQSLGRYKFSNLTSTKIDLRRYQRGKNSFLFVSLEADLFGSRIFVMIENTDELYIR